MILKWWESDLVFKIEVCDTIYYDTDALCVDEGPGVGVQERGREGGEGAKGTVGSCMHLSCDSTCNLQDILTIDIMMGS